MSKHYILGASGVIGSELFNTLKQINSEVFGTYFKNKLFDDLEYFDIEKDSVSSKYSIQKDDIVYIFSSIIDPNFIFKNQEKSNLLNVLSLKRVVEEITSIGTKIVFLSTEIVFNGLKGGYVESDQTDPQTLYGKQKIEIETYIKKKSDNYLILRTGAIVPWGKGLNCPVSKTYDTLLQDKPKMIKDNLFTITDVQDIVSVIMILNDLKIKNEIFHVVSNPAVYRTQLASSIIQISSNKLNKYETVLMEDINYPEPRPLFSWLDNSKLKSLIDFDFRDASDIIKEKVKQIDGWYNNE